MATLDDRAIIEACTRMAWYADHRNWTALATIFADEVLLDYTSLNGGEPVRLSPDQLVGAWSGVLGGYDTTQHLLTNHLVDVDGDRATCTAAFQATHRLANPHGGSLWTLGGDYRFDLVRTAAGWRITAVVMTATWADGNQQLTTLAGAKAAG